MQSLQREDPMARQIRIIALSSQFRHQKRSHNLPLTATMKNMPKRTLPDTGCRPSMPRRHFLSGLGVSLTLPWMASLGQRNETSGSAFLTNPPRNHPPALLVFILAMVWSQNIGGPEGVWHHDFGARAFAPSSVSRRHGLPQRTFQSTSR